VTRRGCLAGTIAWAGPVVVTLTLVLSFSGLGWDGEPTRANAAEGAKASFVRWSGAMTIHVLGHLAEVFRPAPWDWLRRNRRDAGQ
jgi:hypothetical protein